jgi:pimeloyl-ACP methyl ester carboxylesterase
MDMVILALSFSKVIIPLLLLLCSSVEFSFCCLLVYAYFTFLELSGIAKRIAAAGYAVYAMDYPGFGLSYGLHGYIASFDGMVEHVIEQYSRIKGF